MTDLISKVAGYARGKLIAPSGPLFRCDGGQQISVVNGRIEYGDRVHLWPGVKISVCGRPERPALVTIGDRTSIGDRTQIHACREVRIGADCMISWDVNIIEHPYHSPSKGPVIIEDGVWVACRAIILSGVRIGKGARVAAGAIVVDDVPPGALVASPKATIKRTA